MCIYIYIYTYTHILYIHTHIIMLYIHTHIYTYTYNNVAPAPWSEIVTRRSARRWQAKQTHKKHKQ